MDSQKMRNLNLRWDGQESSRYPGKAVRVGDAWRTRWKQGLQASGDPGESGLDGMPEVRGEGRAASPDKRQRENRASPAHGVGASSSGWGCVESHLSLHQLAWVPIPELQPSVPANQ